MEPTTNQFDDMKLYAALNAVPIMADETNTFIADYIRTHNVKKVLEIGTAIGYSAITFAKAADDVQVTTIELDEDRYRKALQNIEEQGVSNRVTAVLGDAAQYETTEQFDLIFIDGPKAQYIPHFEKFKHNLAEGGVIITDNLSFHGFVEDLSLTNNYSTKKLVKKIQKYITFLEENTEFETEFFPIGDRISVTRRRPS